jgi:hypothetical protein
MVDARRVIGHVTSSLLPLGAPAPTAERGTRGPIPRTKLQHSPPDTRATGQRCRSPNAFGRLRLRRPYIGARYGCSWGGLDFPSACGALTPQCSMRGAVPPAALAHVELRAPRRGNSCGLRFEPTIRRARVAGGLHPWARLRQMARARIELATPRFSGVRSILSNGLEMPANKPNLDGRPTGEKSADSVLLVVAWEMSGAPSPIDNRSYPHRDTALRLAARA